MDRSQEDDERGGGRLDSQESDTRPLNDAARGEAEGLLTLICITCGNEYYFGPDSAPEPLECEKCHGTVFRSFYTHRAGDEAAADFQESTGRDLKSDDAEGDTLPGDLIDLR